MVAVNRRLFVSQRSIVLYTSRAKYPKFSNIFYLVSLIFFLFYSILFYVCVKSFVNTIAHLYSINTSHLQKMEPCIASFVKLISERGLQVHNSISIGILFFAPLGALK